jgi:hypothetical protein
MNQHAMYRCMRLDLTPSAGVDTCRLACRGILASIMRRPGTWCIGALLAIALLVIAILCAVYAPRPSSLPPAPAFSTGPALLSTTTTSIDVEMQVDRTSLLQYLLLPASSVRGDVQAQTVQDAIIGMAAPDVQVGGGTNGTGDAYCCLPFRPDVQHVIDAGVPCCLRSWTSQAC